MADISQVEIDNVTYNVSDPTARANADLAKNFINDTFKTGAGFHNSIYRGKDITSKLQDGSLHAAISDGTFNDIFPGDYFYLNCGGISGTIVDEVDENEATYKATSVTTTAATSRLFRIMHLNYFINRGAISMNTNHAVIMPDNTLGTAPMNPTNTTEGSYVGSDMYTKVMPVVDSVLTTAFNNSGVNLLVHDKILPNATSNGASSSWAWSQNTVKACLCNQVQVFGDQAWVPNGYEVGIDYPQFAAFALNPELVSKQRASWWLRSVWSAAYFCDVGGGGNATSYYDASSLAGVRPHFLIG